MFFYDFGEKEGNFSFRTYNEGNLKGFRVSFPEQVEVIGYTVFPKNTGQDTCFINEGQKNSELYCEYLKEKENYEFSIQIKEKKEEEFFPNGIFYLRTPLDNTFSGKDLEKHSGLLMEFKLGEKYRCSEKCVTFEMGSNLIYNSNKNYFRIYPGFGKNGREDQLGGFNRFVINMYDYGEEKDQGVFLALSISLLAGLILIIFDHLTKRKTRKI